MSDLMPRTITGIALVAFLGTSFYLGGTPAIFVLLLISSLVFVEIIRVGLDDYLHFNPLKVIVPNLIILMIFVGCIIFYRGDKDFISLVVITMVTVSMADSCAYFAGKFFGKSIGVKLFKDNYQLAPTISANKTKVGAIGGIVGGVVSFCIMSSYFLEISFVGSIILGLFVTIVSILGDLFQSYSKRIADVKDSGTEITAAILKGHGGFWDRFDSHMPALSIVLLLSHSIT